MVEEKDLEKIKEAIAKSGYPLENIVARIFNQEGFYSETNHNFQDQDTGVSREIDVYGISTFRLKREDDYLFPVLLAQCKNWDSPLIFFMQENVHKDISQLGNIRFTGEPQDIQGRKYIKDLIDYIDPKFHHYVTSDEISTQFCYLEKKGDKYNVEHSRLYNDIVIPLIKSVQSEIFDHEKMWTHAFEANDFDPDNENLNFQIYYPLIIVSGDLLACHIEENSINLESVDRLVLRRHYESKSISGYYYIDVVKRDCLSEFLSRMIRQEMKKIGELLTKNHDVLIKNLKRRYKESKKR